MDALFRVLGTNDDDAAAAAVAVYTGDINELNWAERTVLIEAVRRRLRRTIISLGARGDCDAELCTWKFGAIHAAALNRMAVPVLEAFPHVNVNRQGPDGVTALHCSCLEGAVDDVKALLAHGADPTILDVRGRTLDVLVGETKCRDLAATFRLLFAEATSQRLAWMRVCVSAVEAF